MEHRSILIGMINPACRDSKEHGQFNAILASVFTSHTKKLCTVIELKEISISTYSFVFVILFHCNVNFFKKLKMWIAFLF